MVHNIIPGDRVRHTLGDDYAHKILDAGGNTTDYWPAGCTTGTVVWAEVIAHRTYVYVKSDHPEAVGTVVFRPNYLERIEGAAPRPVAAPTSAPRTLNNRFKQGSGAYTCANCGKRTRDTGLGEADCGLCAKCYEAELEANAVSDDGVSPEPGPEA